MIEQLIELAKVIIIHTNNFIHGIDHIVRVYDLALEIANGIDEELTEDEKQALKLASYWHDIGRVDVQSYTNKYNHADNSAETLLIVAKKYDLEDNSIIKIAISAIKNHRRNNGKIDDNLKVDKILWDADKLDIFNTSRILRIINDYNKYGNNGEYNLDDSIKFWNSIDEKFSNNFHFEVSKEIFRYKYPKFKNLINKIMNEKR